MDFVSIELVLGIVIAAIVAAVAFGLGYSLQKRFTSAQIKGQAAEAQKQLAEAEARSKDIVLKVSMAAVINQMDDSTASLKKIVQNDSQAARRSPWKVDL